MSVEDATFRCNGCGAREVVPAGFCQPWGEDAKGPLDSVHVNLPAGWEHRYGSKGVDHLDLCPKCLADRARYSC